MVNMDKKLIGIALMMGSLSALFPNAVIIIFLSIIVLGIGAIKSYNEKPLSERNKAEKIFDSYVILTGLIPITMPLIAYLSSYGVIRMIVLALTA